MNAAWGNPGKWGAAGCSSALAQAGVEGGGLRCEEIGRAHVELQSLMRISYAVFCLKKNKTAKKRVVPDIAQTRAPHNTKQNTYCILHTYGTEYHAVLHYKTKTICGQ